MYRTELERKAKTTAGQILQAKGYISKYANSSREELYSAHYISRRLKQAKPKPPGATLGTEHDFESRLASSTPLP